MSDEEKILSTEEVVAAAVNEFKRIQKEEEAERKRVEEEKKAMRDAIEKELREEIEAEVKEEQKTWENSKGAANIKKETKTGFADEDQVMFSKYLRREVDDDVARKALQEDAGSEGGYLVPEDWNSQFIQLRDPLSWPRRAGVQQLNTSRDVLHIPAEATSFTKFDYAAEEGSYTSNDPAFAENAIDIHKWTKIFRVSEELVADNAYNLESNLQQMIARSVAATEAYYTAVGTGSSQHEGVIVGCDTDTVTLDSDGYITPDEVWEIFYSLGGGYRPNAFWLMDDQTWRYILSLRDANNWAFSAADMAQVNVEGADGMLCGKRVFLQDDIDTFGATAGNVVIAFGDPFYYALVDRSGLSIQRLDELYVESGQIGYACRFRQGGGVLYESAFVSGVIGS